MTERDLNKDPYDRSEQRAAKYLFDVGVGGGDDPVGFLIASHVYAMIELKRLRGALDARTGANGQ
jgi:hypothetical protein